MLQTYHLLSLLIDLPTDSTRAALTTLMDDVVGESLLSDESLETLNEFVEYAASFATTDEWTAEYLRLFDHTTIGSMHSLALHLDHVAQAADIETAHQRLTLSYEAARRLRDHCTARANEYGPLLDLVLHA